MGVLLAAPRLADLGVAPDFGLPPGLAPTFLGVKGAPPELAALALSFRLILPNVTLAEPCVYFFESAVASAKEHVRAGYRTYTSKLG